jgi:uncharacterized membrane protein
MKKKDFLVELGKALGRLPEAEKADILSDYDEHFRAGMDSGRPEEAIAEALGNPRVLGRSFLIESMIDAGTRKGSAASVLRAVFASLGLGMLNLLVVLAPFAVFIAVIVSLWATAAGLSLSGIAAIVVFLARPGMVQFVSSDLLNAVFVLAGSLGVSALGLLALFAMWHLSRWFIFAVARYVQFNVRIVTSRR